jgi:hypothetical protein
MSIIMMGVMAALALIVGGVVDYASLGNEKRQLQMAADGAALAAARELVVTAPNAERAQAVAEAYVAANFQGEGVVVVARLAANGGGVEVDVSADPQVYFPGPIGANAGRVSANASAGTYGGGSVCMIGLSATAKSTLRLTKASGVTAEGCAIYSNSGSNEGIKVEDNAVVTASFICSAGGVAARKGSQINPAAVTDCPVIDDPLAGRAEPSVGPCTFTNYELRSGASATLQPGVYCGGMKIQGAATLAAGVYIIKNGELKVDHGGSLVGEHAGFFLTGTGALINFEKDSTIELSGPRTGPLAGLLFFESHNVQAADGGVVPDGPPPPLQAPKEHRIRSNNARELVGTIYLPRNRLLIDGDRPIADRSDYTVIVAREFTLAEGPVVVLNTRYAISDVPVPEGVGNRSTARTRLLR